MLNLDLDIIVPLNRQYIILLTAFTSQWIEENIMVLGKKRTGKKRTGNKRTGKKRIRKRPHAEKSALGKDRTLKKAH